MKRRDILALAAGSALTLREASAQFASDKNLRIIMGFPAGSSMDSVARTTSAALEKILNTNVILEYKTGAGGRIGNTYAKNAKPDGSTLLINTSSLMSIYPHVFKKLPYDPLKDFIPVTSIVNFCYGFVVSNQIVPASVKSLNDYVQWAKANPGQRNYGSPASGSMPHFVGTLLSQATGLKLNHVSFNGGAPHLQALSGGHIPMGVDVVGAVLPQLAAGRIRLLATCSTDVQVPGVPTVGEAGFPDLLAEDYFGLFYPAQTPVEHVNRIHVAVKAALQQELPQETFRKFAFKPSGADPAQFSTRVRSEFERWRKVVQESGFTLED